MTTTSTEERSTTVPKSPLPLPCDPTSDRPVGIEFNGDELRDFLSAINCDWTKPLNRNFELLERIHRVFDAEVESGRLPVEALPSLKRTVEVAGGLTGDLFSNYHPFELKVQVGIYTSVAFEIDDLCERDAETMIPAIQRFLATWADRGSSPHHPYLDYLLRVTTTELPKFFGPITMANIVHSTVGFLAGCLTEAAYPQGVPCPPSSPRYPTYLRVKTGASEVFAHFVFPDAMFPEAEYFETYITSMPDFIEWINLGNDILSFYKESVVGTCVNTYLMTKSKLLGRSPVDVWRDSCKRQLKLGKDISLSLSRKEELRKAWESFMTGYCAFYLVQHKRYRLREIGFHTSIEH